MLAAAFLGSVWVLAAVSEVVAERVLCCTLSCGQDYPSHPFGFQAGFVSLSLFTSILHMVSC